ncbi:hypothetical protein ACFQGT_03465 [Natrialbaceae archaeon GCM10025810]|uniref:hypothetical protein n=1 Tax=Halovalidus salilacus TaxID=3075124 RepID=UPI00361B2D6D
MTPIAFVTAFCTALALADAVRLARSVDRTRADVGSTAVVVGVTLWTWWWASLDAAWLGSLAHTVLAVCGALSIGAGLAVMWRHWDEVSVDAP